MVRAADKKRLSNATLGLILAVILAIASYLAFTKSVPWGGGTEYQIAFNSAQNLRVNSPVRIAGVNVGEVTSVEPIEPSGDEESATPEQSATGSALVTIELSDEGLPLKEDSTFTLRPRLFLEGNLFVDVSPGSPSAAEQDPGQPFPLDSTNNSVQLDQILTGSLQADSRRDLQVFLDEFGTALDPDDPNGGAQSFRTLYKTSPGAFRATSQVNEATLGEHPHDLSGLIKNLDKVIRGLGRNEKALKDTITNFRIVSGSFAAQDSALEQAIVELPRVLEAADPAFTNLNAAFPPLRAFSREILPGVRSAPKTLDAATPLLQQVRLLSRKSELRGLARELVPAVPPLARLSARTPKFLEQSRALSSCFNEVVIPWSLDKVEGPAGYPFPAVGEVYKETAYGLTGIAGESRSQDANGQYIRVAGGGGTNTISGLTNVITTVDQAGETFAGTSAFDLLGAVPGPGSSKKTPFKPNAPCENQEAPDLSAASGAPPSQSPVPNSTKLGAGAGGLAGKTLAAQSEIADAVEQYGTLKADGDDAAARAVKKDLYKSVHRYYRKFGG